MARFAAVLVLVASALCVSGAQIQIIHINDPHARYEPADARFGTQCNGTQVDACFGGFARQMTAINQLRAAADQRGIDTLVLHAGDQYTGTLWDSFYTRQGVQIAPEFLEMLGVQSFTLGNHEFDYGASGAAGAAGFIANVSGAFPVLSCNLDVSKEPELQGLVERYALIPLPHSNLTVGVVGLTAIDTPQTSNPGPTLSFLPYEEVLPGCVADARADGANLVIGLTHIGFAADAALAAGAAASGLDVIVGGHSHTLLWGDSDPGQEQAAAQPPPILASPPTNESTVPAGPYPYWVLNSAANKAIPVVQALYGSRYLGVLDVTWEGSRGVAAASGTPLLLGGTNSTNPVPEDPYVARRIAELCGPLDAYNAAVVGSSTVDLDGERADIRTRETNLGDLMCDAIVQFAQKNTRLLEGDPPLAAVCLINGGVFRASIPAGSVTEGQILATLPYGNWFQSKLVTASTLQAALNSGLSGWTSSTDSAGRFPQVSGMRYALDPTLPSDRRLVAAELLVDGATVPLEGYNSSIVLLTTDYIAGGGDFYDMLAPLPLLYDSSTPLAEILSIHFQQNSPISIETDGRIVNCAQDGSGPLCTAAVPAAAPPPSAAQSRAAWHACVAVFVLLACYWAL